MFKNIRINSVYKHKHILFLNRFFKEEKITKKEKDEYMKILSKFKGNKIDKKKLEMFKQIVINSNKNNKPVVKPDVKPDCNISISRKHLYIYGKITNKSCYQIVKHMIDNNKKLFDIISVFSLFNTEASFFSKYDVICLDYLVTHFLPENMFIKFLDMLNFSGKKIVFHLHDLHEYSFKYCKPIQTIHKNRIKGKSIYPTNVPSYGVKKICEQIKRGNCQYIISYYDNVELRNILNSYKNIKKHIVIPFHVETKIFKDYRMPKKYDILLIGSYDKDSYNFRNRLYHLLKKYNKVFKLKVVTNINYNSSISKIINSSWLTIATYSNFHYLVRKYFEISASKSVILGNMTHMGKKIWGNNYVHIDREMTNSKIINIIKTALLDKNKLKNMSNIMYKKIHSEYNYNKLSDKYYIFFNIVNNE